MKDLSLHLMDIMQNSVVVDSTYVEVGIKVEKNKNCLTIYVKDDGWGMSPETMHKVSNPFYTTRTTRKAGLGIPLFQSASEIAGGKLTIDSEVNVGTTITATFEIDNIDRKPLGDIASTFTMLILGHPNMEFHLILENDDAKFVLKTEEIKEVIGDLPITDTEIIRYLNDMINENISLIFGGILYEIIS